MRYKKLLVAAMSAIMVLSGCNTDKPEETSAVTEEVTTAATEVTTTTTIAPVMTAVSVTEPLSAPNIDITGYTEIQHDPVPHTVTVEKLEIFDKAFYGKWENGRGEKADLTYNAFNGRIFKDTTVSIWNVCETEEAYVLVLFEGGAARIMYILKDDPETLYDRADVKMTDGKIYCDLRPDNTDHNKRNIYTSRDASDMDNIYEIRRRTYLCPELEQRLENEYRRLISEYMLGVWRPEQNNMANYDVIVGVNEKYSDAMAGFPGGGYPEKITIDDEKTEVYLVNYVGDISVIEIYPDKPDELILTEIYFRSGEEARQQSVRYRRIDTAGMYPKTGKLNKYIYTLLHYRGFAIFGPDTEIEYEGKIYSNDAAALVYVTDTPEAEDFDYELIEDNGDSMVFSSLFYEVGDETYTLVKRFGYELHRDGNYWKLGEYYEI